MPFDAEITTKCRDRIVDPLPDDALDVLKAARKLLKRGWMQCSTPGHSGHYDWVFPLGPFGRHQPTCMAKAVAECAKRHPGWHYLPALGLGGQDIYAVARWNDTPGRTKAEVLARFDAAIERLSQ